MPCTIWFSRRRLVGSFLFTACAGVVLVAISLVMPSPRAWASPFASAYQQVKPGMTLEEAVTILGRADREKDCKGGMLDFTWAWTDGHQEIDVTFELGWQGEPTLVKSKRFYPETMWNYLWSR
jgi:hypothetical protein